MRPLCPRRHGNRRIWWTRERVIIALIRFYRDFATMPTSCHEWQTLTAGDVRKPWERRYPSSASILGCFPSYRDAWAATGLPTNRRERPWTPVEEWYLREGAGLLSRQELARDLRRTPDAVHRRLYDLGLHSYRQHGWSIHRLEAETGISFYWFRKAIRGGMPVVRGSRSYFVQPCDVVLRMTGDWSGMPPAFTTAALAGLRGRLVGILAMRGME